MSSLLRNSTLETISARFLEVGVFSIDRSGFGPRNWSHFWLCCVRGSELSSSILQGNLVGKFPRKCTETRKKLHNWNAQKRATLRRPAASACTQCSTEAMNVWLTYIVMVLPPKLHWSLVWANVAFVTQPVTDNLHNFHWFASISVYVRSLHWFCCLVTGRLHCFALSFSNLAGSFARIDSRFEKPFVYCESAFQKMG